MATVAEVDHGDRPTDVLAVVDPFGIAPVRLAGDRAALEKLADAYRAAGGTPKLARCIRAGLPLAKFRYGPPRVVFAAADAAGLVLRADWCAAHMERTTVAAVRARFGAA